MSYYPTPKIIPTIYNSKDYIDDTYITKQTADDLYINEIPVNNNLEQLLGNLNVIGDETVTNQYVTGNSMVNGNFTAKSNVTLGNYANLYVNGGLTKLGSDASNQVKSNAITIDATSSITIGNNASSGDISMGNFTTNKLYITPKEVHLGENPNLTPYSSVDVQGTTTNINSRSNTGDVSIGNSTSNNTSLSGKKITITGNNDVNDGVVIDSTNGKVTIGNGSSGTQHNVLLGYRNKIYNPQLCSRTGGDVIDRNFHLNRPHIYNFSRLMSYTNGNNNPPNSSSLVTYVNLPNLKDYITYAVTMEFAYCAVFAQGSGASISFMGADSMLNSVNMNSNPNGSRYLYGVSNIIINKTGGVSNTTWSILHLPLLFSGSAASIFAPITFPSTVGLSSTSVTPFTVIKSPNTDNQLQITIAFPVTSGSANLNSTTFHPVVFQGHIKVLNSLSLGLDYAYLPDNTESSEGGTAYFSSS